jgi:hypothetical protein
VQHPFADALEVRLPVQIAIRVAVQDPDSILDDPAARESLMAASLRRSTLVAV